MDAHLIAAFDESVSDLSQRRGGTESMALRKKAPACDRGSVFSAGWSGPPDPREPCGSRLRAARPAV